MVNIFFYADANANLLAGRPNLAYFNEYQFYPG